MLTWLLHVDPLAMIHLKTPLTPEQLDAIEALSCEREQSRWMLYDDREGGRCELNGYFDTAEEAQQVYALLRADVADLPETASISTLEDKDWKEAYKEHFHPWSEDGLHWVPLWEKDTYTVPEGEAALYLDPGMAFGTGNHETTRLCALRLVKAAREWGERVSEMSIRDVGCGSGILSLSAAKLGFSDVRGFDIDPDSVEVAHENAAANGLEQQAHFECLGLPEGVEPECADLVLANILAPTLKAHAAVLLGAVKPGGWLVLSGILAEEVESVKAVFEAQTQMTWAGYEVDSRIDGQWADICLRRM